MPFYIYLEMSQRAQKKTSSYFLFSAFKATRSLAQSHVPTWCQTVLGKVQLRIVWSDTFQTSVCVSSCFMSHDHVVLQSTHTQTPFVPRFLFVSFVFAFCYLSASFCLPSCFVFCPCLLLVSRSESTSF